MRAPVSFGYLRPTAGRVTGSSWSVTSSDGSAAQGGVLPGWDYFTPVHVERDLRVDLDGVRRTVPLLAGRASAGF